MANETLIVKVGGSLYGWPDLGPRLQSYLATLTTTADVILVPGGGPTADVIRGFDKTHRLGEETAHWLALRALTLNAHFLHCLLPDAEVISGELDIDESRRRLSIIDAFAFARTDESRSGSLPHVWAAGSDALAARVATVCDAASVRLLKSITIPLDLDWDAAAAQGFVDVLFPDVLRQCRNDIEVKAVNLREWTDDSDE